jgi:hypothetical protein
MRAIFDSIRGFGCAACKALPHCLLTSMLAIGLFGFTREVSALPVTYELVIGFEGPGSGPSGALGSFAFGNNGYIQVVLDFQGDTANVVPWTTGGANPVHGYEIRTGTASVEIKDTSGNVLAQGTFDPSAGIFVSIDNTNLGIGFGSHAVWPPTDPNFPGLPAYPFGDWMWGAVGITADPSTYDLKSNFDSGLNTGWSCVSFPSFDACTPPIMLPTSAGDFYLNPLLSTNIVWSYLHTIVQSTISFESFSAQAQISDNKLHVSGNLKLEASSGGINPVTDTVTIGFGSSSVSLAPGSFKLKDRTHYTYSGVVNGVALQVRLTRKSIDSYYFSIVRAGYKDVVAGTPINLSLTIGSDAGSASVTPSLER